MDQKSNLSNKPLAGMIVIVVVALFVGGWLYVDMVRSELERKIDALSAQVAEQSAMQKADAAKTQQAMPAENGGPLVLPTLPQGTTMQVKTFSDSGLASIYQYAQSCGVKFSSGFIASQEANVSGRQSYQYHFTLSGSGYSSLAPAYDLRVVPNPGYADLDAVKKDFVACDAGVESPVFVNADWIVLGGSCGGVADDNGLPLGCETVANVILSQPFAFR